MFGYDFNLAGKQLRLFKAAHELADSEYISSSKERTDALRGLIQKMDSNLFPWIKTVHNNTEAFRSSFSGSGIVICVNDKYFKEALATLKIIRQVHDCNLPVEVFYAGEEELSAENRETLEQIPYTITRDIKSVFDDSKVKIYGYGIKPFALLASSFRNTILIDADVFFFQSPENLLNNADFQKNRALFFTDRVLMEGDIPDAQNYVKNLLPQPLHFRVLDLALFKGTSFHTQESGVVVIDKYARFFGIMASCFLNVGNVRTASYSHMHGDKETFWIGFETVRDDYVFNKYPSGAIGVATKPHEDLYEICSVQLLHVDSWQRPLWLNGGLIRNKNTHDQTLVTPEEWIIGPGSWRFEDGYLACLTASHSSRKLSEQELYIFNASKEIYLGNS